MLTTLLIITIITQIILALFVVLKKPKDLTHILFGMMSLTSLGWALVNYATLAALSSEYLIVLVRFILFFVVVQNSIFYLFARAFPEPRWKYSIYWLVAYILFSAVVASATISPYVFTSVNVHHGLANTEVGLGMILFVVHAGLSIGVAFWALVTKEKQADGLHRKQLQLLIGACILNWVVVPITNFALTPLLKTTVFIEFSPFYNLLFSALIGYTIISHKLFDIRPIVARSVTYIVLVGAIAMIYASSIAALAKFVFTDSTLSAASQNITYIILAVILSATLQPLKAFIDKATNKVFYQDSYDSQELINSINSTLVNTLDLEKLLTQAASIIESRLNVSYCEFFLEPQAAKSYNISKSLQSVDWPDLAKHLLQYKESVVLGTDQNIDRSTAQAMRKHKLECVIKMNPNGQNVGMLLVGERKSGIVFNSHDVQILEIIADEVAIAVQNTLRFEEISHFNMTLQNKIDEATRQLQRSNEKLKALDEAKDDFVSMASHQLRTPLTSVKGYLSMVLEGDAGDINDAQRTMLGQAYTSAQRMTYLIADLLNLSRLKTGKFVVETVPTNLPDIVSQELSQVRETAKSRNIAIFYDEPKQFPVLMLDETKIRQVIMNFLDNAIYYTPSGGEITLKLTETTQSVEFTVSDTGIGVPKEDQHNLFTKFYRAANARQARPDGTGLGLFMARKVIVAQGGATVFRSQEGKGSTFGFSFPKNVGNTPKQ